MNIGRKWLIAFLLASIFGALYVILWDIEINSAKSFILPIQNYINSETTLSYKAPSGPYRIDLLPSNDYETLINVTNFNFTILNEPCEPNSILPLLVLIHSAPPNNEKRALIRNTWGQQSANVKTLFLLGAVDSDKVQTEIEKENEAHKDIIQGNFVDVYRNLTYKHLMALKYAIYHCPKAKYVMKTDDDIFINMPKLIDFVQIVITPMNAQNCLICPMVHTGMGILRPEDQSKWSVTVEEYPGTEYPRYCGGWVIIYSPQALFTLYQKAQNAPYFWVDDVHITGTMALDTNITHSWLAELILEIDRVNEILQIKDKNKIPDYFLFGSILMSYEDRQKLWNILYG